MNNKIKILKICLSHKGSKRVTELGLFLDMLKEDQKILKLQIKSTKNIIEMEMKKL